MKTIREINHEAGKEVASVWLRGCEHTLAAGHIPAPLESYSRDEARTNLIGDNFYREAHAANERWWVSEKNWKHIAPAAQLYAKQVLRVVGAKQFPRALEHFTKTGGIA